MPKILESPREKILTCARELVIAEGYNKLTIRRISHDTGIAIGTIYNYFPTKKDLTIELMEQYWQDYLHVVRGIYNEQKDFYEKLKMIYLELLNFIRTFLEVWIKNISKDYSSESLQRRQSFTEKIILQFAEILEDSEKKGQIVIPLDSYTTAKFIISNIIMMAQMNMFEYENFEKLIKKLLS